MTKRLISWLLSLLILLSLLPVSSLAAEDTGIEDAEGWLYTVSDGEATITGYRGDAAILEIPDDRGGFPVTAIASGAFSGNTALNILTIPDGVRRIGSGAFSGCSALTAVRIADLAAWCGIEFENASANPLSTGEISLYLYDYGIGNYRLVQELPELYGIEGIGRYAFTNYKKLKTAKFSYTVQSIGDSAFSGCSNLTEAVFPPSLKQIGDSAFSGCTALAGASLPDGLASIGRGAFSGCRAMVRLDFPTSVESVGSSAFSGCRITDVYLSDLAAWCRIAFPDAGSNPLNGAQNLYVRGIPTTDLPLPEGITTIRDYAFYGFQGLKCALLPDSVSIVGKAAFQGCTGLECVLIPDSVLSVAKDAFSSCGSLADIYYTGSQEEWEAVSNHDIFTATVHCGTEKYTVSFLSEVGGWREMTTSAIGDRAYVLPGCFLIAPYGSTFKAWEIGEKEYAEGNTFKPQELADAAGNVNVTARWTGINYTIRFDAGDGTGVMDPVTVPFGSTYPLPESAFTAPRGKVFKAWLIGGSEYVPGNGFTPWRDLTATALWKDVTYTVSFDPGEGSGSMAPGTAVFEQEFTLPDCAFTAPEGKYFKAWRIGEEEELCPAGSRFVAERDTTVTAVWAERFAVSFDPNGGTGEMPPIPVADGNSVKLPDCAFTAPEGMSFKTWMIGDMAYAPESSVTVTGNLTARAVWAKRVTASFEANGGTGSMDSLTVLEGEELTLPECEFASPADKGGFKAWQYGGQEYAPGDTYAPTADIIFTAVWRERFTVTFDAGGGTGVPMAALRVSEGEEAELPVCAFTAPAGMAFKAWRIGENEYLPGERYTVTEDTAVTAVWSVLCTISFDAGDGSGSMASLSYPAGVGFTLPANAFTAPFGKAFRAWRIGDREYAPLTDSCMVTEDTVVTAVWDDVFSVFFIAGGGNGSMSALAVRDGAAVTLPDCGFTAPSGSVFEAWEIDGVKYTIGASFTPARNTEVKAIWNAWYECSVNSGETTVTRYKGSERELTVPEVLGGYPVTGIGSNAFSGCTSLTRVRLPEGVRTVGAYAFNSCTKMVRVELPASIEEIGANAFSGCTELTGAYITDLSAWCAIAFANASANPLSAAKNLYLNDKLVTELTIPRDVAAIGSYAFYNCIRLEKLNTDASRLAEIGSYAFAGCTGLREAGRFPDSLKRIGSYAFYGCTALASIGGFPAGLSAIESYAFNGCRSLSNISLPTGLTTVSMGVFSGCSGLKDVTIPASITAMGSNAFSGCRIDVVRVTDLAKWCRIDFDGAGSNPLNNAQSMYVRNAPVMDLTIQDEITSVSNYAFYGFQGLKCVIIPLNATIIYRYAFTNCTNLEYIMIPVGMQSLGENAFASCGKLKDIYYTGDETRWKEELPNYQQLVKEGVTVHFNAKQITVTLDPGEGSGTPEQTSAISGRPYVLTEAGFTAPAGQHFRAWLVGEQEYLRGQSFTPEADTTVTALWGDITYLVSFSANGGIGEMESRSVKEGESFELPECGFTAPVGKQFKAWRIGEQEYLPGTALKPEADMAAVAVWEPLVCTVTFDPEGGSGQTTPLITTYQTLIQLPECGFTAPVGKEFKAWLLNGAERQPGYSFRPAESMTVAAVWQDLRCSVSFASGEGTGAMGSRVIIYGTEYTLPGCGFAAPYGQAFRAWEIEGRRYAAGDVITVKWDLVITAIWADLHHITFNAGEGSGSMGEKTVLDGDVLRLPNCTFRAPAGMQFSCWEIGGEEYLAQDEYAPTSDVTVKALWEPIPCIITLEAGDGRIERLTGSYGYEFRLPDCGFSAPIDLYFKCWKQGSREFKPGDVIVPTTNMTFTAEWTGLYLFTVDSDKTTVTGYTGDETELTIPARLGGYPVVGIGASAFARQTGVTAVTIPAGVTSIGRDAFNGCTALTEAKMPEGLLSIGQRAFYGCAKLEKAEIPDSVVTIGRDAFNGCKSLTGVKAPSSLKSVGSNAFSGCTELTGVYVTDLAGWCGVEFENANANPVAIAKNLYLNGRLVEQLTFPEEAEVPVIGNYAFYNCVWMEGVELPGSLASIGSYAFTGCVRLKKIEIPEHVTALGSYAFSGCTALEEAVIPVGVTTIPEALFLNCSALKGIDLPTGLAEVGANAFSGCRSMTEVTVPGSVAEIRSNAFSGCASLEIVYVEDLAAWCRISFASALSNPLYYAKSLYYRGVPVTDLTIQNNITIIRTYAFNHFQGLRCVIIPEKTTVILKDAFTNCGELEYVLIPEGMGSLGDNAFNNCAKLHDIYFTGTEEQWKMLPNFQQFMKDTITIHYQAEKITVTFASEDGTETLEETSAISGRPYVLTGCAFAPPEGKVFRAWKIGDGEYGVGDSVTATEDMTITPIWVDVMSARVEEDALSYEINVPIPEGAKLLAAGYTGDGRLLWTVMEAEPEAAGGLTVEAADRIKLFLIRGDTAVPICMSWESEAE